MNHLQYKLALLEQSSQIIVLDEHGVILKTCNTLRNLNDLKESVFEVSPFFESQRDQIITAEIGTILLSSCITDNLFNNELICDHRIEIGVNNGKRVIYWLIEDHTLQYQHLNVVRQKGNEGKNKRKRLSNLQQNLEKENIELKRLVEDLEKEKQLKEKIVSSLNGDIRTPIKGLKYLSKSAAEYLEGEVKTRFLQRHGFITGYLENTLDKIICPNKLQPNKPYKLDQIISATKDIFFGFFDRNLIFEQQFESSIIIGKKYKLLFDMIKMLGLIMEYKPDGNIRIKLTYQENTKTIHIAFKVNLLAGVLKKIQQDFLFDGDTNEVYIERSSLIFLCPIESVKGLKMPFLETSGIAQKKSITKSSFPYLYKITNQDEEMVREIIEGVLDVVPFELDKMYIHFQDKDYESLARTSHKIKPNFENLEQKQFTKSIYAIEEAALSKNDLYLGKNLEKFIDAANEKIAEFKNAYL